MGKFFNEVLMPLHRIPLGQKSMRSPVEKMRRNFNEENKQEEEPEMSLEEKRRINLAKAREAKRLKKEEANG